MLSIGREGDDIKQPRDADYNYLVLLKVAEPIKVGPGIEERPGGRRMVILENRAIVVKQRLERQRRCRREQRCGWCGRRKLMVSCVCVWCSLGEIGGA